MSGATPEPGEVDTKILRDGHIAVLAADYGIAKVWSVEKSERSTHEANAHLIAAAPELLEALRGLVQYAEQLELLVYTPAKDDGADHDTIRNAKAALAKADPLSMTDRRGT